MELYVLDDKYDAISIIDTFESVIWSDRFNDIGDFEIYAPVNISGFESLKTGNYLYRKDNDKIMRINTIEIETDAENGDHIIVTGESLEEILKHYVVHPAVTLSGNLQNGVKKLITDFIINPTNSARKISNFVFKDSTDSKILSLSFSDQIYCHGENLFDTIQSICIEYKIGFRIFLNNENQYVFELYSGKDRSYSQEKNPWVVFSPSLDNFNSSNYVESDKNYASTCYVVCEITRTVIKNTTDGQGVEMQEDVPLETEVNIELSDAGIKRREIFLDVGKLDTENLSEAISQMTEKGKEKLNDYKKISDFEGVIEPYRQYIYGKDYFVGDIVQVVNKYGREATSRVAEVVYSFDTTGERIIPTFSSLK